MSIFFAFLQTKVIDIANIKNLVTFIEFCDEERRKTEAAFIDSIDLLHFSEINAADAKNNTRLSDRSYI